MENTDGCYWFFRCLIQWGKKLFMCGFLYFTEQFTDVVCKAFYGGVRL